MNAPTEHDAGSVMFCCNEVVGLGHLRRTLTLAEYLQSHTSLTSQLIVTGSPVPQKFPLPDGSDYINLPSAVKASPGTYASRSIQMPFSTLSRMRRDILLSAARHFQPDVLLVDHAPAGIAGEMIPTLRYLKDNSPHTRLVLGVRDIVDNAAHVRRAWAQRHVYDLLDDVYDLILVYGQRDIHDVVAAYGFSARAAEKTRYVGYLRREAGPRSTVQLRAELGMQTDRLVVITAGGGVDGYALFRTALEALRQPGQPLEFDCLLVTGPLLPPDDRSNLMAMVEGNPHLHVLDFSVEMADYIRAADVVVSMGGYNTMCEILSFQRPGLIVPRVAPSQEQLIRAEALSQRHLVRMLHPDDLTSDRLLDEVRYLLEHSIKPSVHLAMEGLPKVAAELMKMMALPSRQVASSFVPAPTPPVTISARKVLT